MNHTAVILFALLAMSIGVLVFGFVIIHHIKSETKSSNADARGLIVSSQEEMDERQIEDNYEEYLNQRCPDLMS